MFQRNMDKIQSHFTKLINDVQKALEKKEINISDIRKYLIRFFRREDCIPKGSFDEVFNAVTLNDLWNFPECSCVEMLVENFIPEEESMVKTYKAALTGFYLGVKVLDYIKHTNIPGVEEDDNPSPPELCKELHQNMKVKLNPKAKISDLSLLYVHRLWISIREVYDPPSLTAVLHSIKKGCLEIIWLILPHDAEKIAASAYKNIPFFYQHNIIHIAIDGRPVYDEMVRTILHVDVCRFI